MKNEVQRETEPEMLPEYDFSKGIRGKYAQWYTEGVSFRVLSQESTETISSEASVKEELLTQAQELLVQIKSARQMDRLIIILLLEDEYIGNRDEAAMDLAEYNDPLVERVLIQVASNPKIDPIIAYSCGNSLAEIWKRQNRFPVEVVKAFGEDARFGVRQYLLPEWVEQFELTLKRDD